MINALNQFLLIIIIKEISEIDVNHHGCVEAKDVIDAIKPNTILISIMLANNETGVLQVIHSNSFTFSLIIIK